MTRSAPPAKERLQRKAIGLAPGRAPSIVGDVLRSPGKALDPPTRERMESRLGHDFSTVRIHSDPRAAESAGAVNAAAYTVGAHVAFGEGRYRPESAEGRDLLAHELVHVVQQGARAHPDHAQLEVGDVADHAEREAEAVARRTPTGRNATAFEPRRGSASSPRLARQPVAQKFWTLDEEILDLLNKRPTGDPGKVSTWTGQLQGVLQRVPADKAQKLHRRLSSTGPKADALGTAFTAAVGAPGNATRTKLLLILERQFAAAPASPPTLEDYAKSAAGSTPSAAFTALNAARAKPEYIDNGIERLRSDGATAEIFYKDGATLTLGLDPDTIQAPFVGIDYKSTGSTARAALEPTTEGTFRFAPMPQPEAATKMPYGKLMEGLEKRARDVKFVIEPKSKRLVPIEVNSSTAPLLCATLRKADEENEELAQATSAGGVKVFKMFGLVLEIASFMTPAKMARTGQLAKGGGAVAMGRVASMMSKMRAILAKTLGESASKGTVINEVVAEGVSFGAMKATVKDTALTVRYSFIVNVGKTPNAGKVAQWALEQAAKDVAKAQGAKSARVIVDHITNPAWKSYLESQGYKWFADEMPTGMMKVLPL